MSERKGNTRAVVWLNNMDEEFAPPEQPVLGIEVIGDRLYLAVSRYEETYGSSTYTTVAEVAVDMHTFLKALLASTDKDTLLWATQLPALFTETETKTKTKTEETPAVDDDIVTQLRNAASYPASLRGTPLAFVAMQAADEIERLRTVVDPEFFMLRGRIDILEREIERLRAAGDAIAATYWDVWQCNGIGIGTIQRAYEGWEEARRG